MSAGEMGQPPVLLEDAIGKTLEGVLSRPGTCCGQVDMLMPTLNTCREFLPSSCSREEGMMSHMPAV